MSASNLAGGRVGSGRRAGGTANERGLRRLPLDAPARVQPLAEFDTAGSPPSSQRTTALLLASLLPRLVPCPLPRSLCQYAREWAVYIPEESVATRLADSCAWLTNPTIMAVFQKKTGLVAQNQAVPDDKKQEFTQQKRRQLLALAAEEARQRAAVTATA